MGSRDMPPGTTTDLLCPNCGFRRPVDISVLDDVRLPGDTTVTHPCAACGEPYPDILIIFPGQDYPVAS